MRFSGGCVGEIATMEVPLPMLFPPPCSSGLDDDADDIPPSPTPDPSTPSLASRIFFQRGFLDCAEEAMRFLTDMEGMPENSPVIAGLKEHLVHSSQQFTPASLAPPSPTFFTFPSLASDAGVMRRKQLFSSVVSSVQGASHSCVPSSRSDSVRFSPYTVTSHRNASSRLPRTGMEKDSTVITETSQISNIMHSSTRPQSTTCPLTKSLESVLKDDLISTDDLHGVLKCLQSVQSPGLSDHHQHNLTVTLSDHAQHLAATMHPSTHLSVPICHQSVHSVHSCTVPSKVNSYSSLNDSGVSADLTDEVDGLGHSAVDNVSDDVFHSAQNCQQRMTEEMAGREKSDSLLCSASATATSMSSSTSQVLSSDTPLSSSSLPASSPVTVSAVPESSPSSQLSLLSSLSSGTHRLTAQSGEGSATAARIQSLANEILLLLQEEAEANDSEDEETDVEHDDDDEYSHDESDEDSAVEMEP